MCSTATRTCPCTLPCTMPLYPPCTSTLHCRRSRTRGISSGVARDGDFNAASSAISRELMELFKMHFALFTVECLGSRSSVQLGSPIPDREREADTKQCKKQGSLGVGPGSHAHTHTHTHTRVALNRNRPGVMEEKKNGSVPDVSPRGMLVMASRKRAPLHYNCS